MDQPRLTADNSNAHLGTAYLSIFTRGNKLFELTNHLGNVLVTVTDGRIPAPKSGTPSQVGSYTANMVVATDYTPFGMIMQGRNYNNAAGDKYRYGFNGQEYDNSIKGTVNHFTAEFWEYDPRAGRRWNVDPILKPGESPYAAFSNNPIWNIDPDGADTTKYLSNSQVMDAVKIGYNTINDDVRNRTYNAAKDVSKRLQAAVDAYWDKHQDQFSVGAYAEFRDATFAYHKGLQEVATWNADAWNNLGKRITNDNISDQTNLAQTNYTIAHYNGSTAGLVTTGANVALGEAAGGVLIGPGPGPRGPQINSKRQQEIVNIGIRNSVPKNINPGQQGKHIVGHNNYQGGKSILTTDAQTLLNEFHAGQATILRQPNANRVIVEFNRPIGTYIKQGATEGVPTTRGTINFGKNGVHIVPSAPK